MLVLLLLATVHLISGKSSSISLTVEGGVSLVGPQCPETVRLFCEGVDLSTLRWRVNETDLTGLVFFPDDNVGTVRTSSNTAILSAELRAVSPSLNDSRFGNFFSILTVNLSELEYQNIVSISCSAPGIGKTVPVDVHITQQTVPGDTQLIGVNASLIGSSMLQLLIRWKQQVTTNYCAGYKERIYFKVTLISNGINSTATVNSSFCGLEPTSVCSMYIVTNVSSVSLKELKEIEENYTVSVQAINGLGTSNISTLSGILSELFSQDPVPPSTQLPDICDAPLPPVKGSIVGQSGHHSLGSEVTYHCDSGLLPTGVMNSTCTDIEGRGEWVPDPALLVCDTIANCSIAGLPQMVYHFTANSSSGSVINFMCKEGYSLIGPPTLFCNESGQWSANISDIECILSVSTTSSIVAGSVGGCLLAVTVVTVIFLTVRRRLKRKNRQRETLEVPGEEIYNQLNHHVSLPTEKHSENENCYVYDSDVSNMHTDQDAPYSRIVLSNHKNAKPSLYCEIEVEADSTDWPDNDPHSVKYSTVDLEATERKNEKEPEATKDESHHIEADQLLNLDQCLVQLREVQRKWREIGEALLIPTTYMEQIETYCADDAAVGMTEVLDYWIRNCSSQPTWRELADALMIVEEVQLATRLMLVYETGQLPIELNFEEVPDDLYKHDTSAPPPIPARTPASNDLSDRNVIEVLPQLPPKPTSYS